MTTFDRTALKQGALVALVFAVPFSFGSAWVHSNNAKSPWVSVLWLAALAGFTLGAGIAAWVQTKGFPLAHALVCAGGTYFATQTLFVIIRLVRGKSVSWLGLFFTFTVVMFAGLIGGGLGSAMRKRGILPSGNGGRS